MQLGITLVSQRKSGMRSWRWALPGSNGDTKKFLGRNEAAVFGHKKLSCQKSTLSCCEQPGKGNTKILPKDFQWIFDFVSKVGGQNSKTSKYLGRRSHSEV
jgi:hypothetical protein